MINWKYFFNIIEIEPINIGLTLFFGKIIKRGKDQLQQTDERYSNIYIFKSNFFAIRILPSNVLMVYGQCVCSLDDHFS